MAQRQRRGRGDGGLYKDGRGLWTAVVELPPDPVTNKRRRKTVRSTKYAVAQAKLKALRVELERTGDLITKAPTVQEWSVSWLKRFCSHLKPRTLEDYEATVAKINQKLGRKPLDKLRADDVLALHEWLQAPKPDGLGLSPTTAGKTHRVLSKMLKDAQRMDKVSENVAKLIPAPSPAASEPPSLTLEQALKFLTTHADKWWVARYAVGLTTGQRQGETLGLQVENVTIERNARGEPVGAAIETAWTLQRIRYQHGCGVETKTGWPCGKRFGSHCPRRHHEIPRSHESKHVTGGLFLLRPKTKGSWRVTDAPQFIAQILDRVIGERTTGFVFTVDGERPMSPEEDWRTWRQWLEDAGLPVMGTHAQRHTSASLLAYFGADEATRMRMLGHTTTKINRRYTHDHDRLGAKAAAEQMEALRFDWRPEDRKAIGV